jgi:protein SCO1/2
MVLGALGVLGSAAALLSACDRAARPAFKGVDITGAEYGQELNLTDADGRARTLADFKGKVTVVFFGYTQCPDVCPTTLAELAQARQLLGEDGRRVQGVFVTIDPERDTPAILKAYVGAFGEDFVGLRGNAEQTPAAAKQFKVFYAKAPGQTAVSYTMDHTAGSYVIDGAGRLRLFERYGAGAEALAADLRQLLAES